MFKTMYTALAFSACYCCLLFPFCFYWLSRAKC